LAAGAVPVDPNVAAKPNDPAPGSPGTQATRAAAKPEPREPIQWQVADGEPPAWLQSSDFDQAEREMREVVRTKLREMITVDYQGTPLRQDMQEVQYMVNLTIILDTVKLG
jgi:hypothetical protein